MRRFIVLAILGLVPALGSHAIHRDDPAIDRIEEDWQLVIQSTDVPSAGPQITTTMCPGPLEDHPDVNFYLNYREGAQFFPGGLQIEVFEGQDTVTTTSSRNESLATDGETISWTQRLSLSAGTVAYQVQSGKSTTWGDFGAEDLSVAFTSSLTDLAGYSPDISISKSGVGWQSNHVTSMKLVQIRYYSGDTLVKTDSTARAVHPSDDN
jgi:hypothetical protein